MPLYRRLAQRGFSNYPFKKEFQVVNLRDIEARYADGEIVDGATLRQKGLIKGPMAVKILGDGTFTKKLTFRISAMSASAKAKIEQAVVGAGGGDTDV
jgi:large subunit ribosomal protein L15